MNGQELIPHLFRTEFRKISPVLCKYFGIEHMDIAEDIASETFLSALENWPYKGLPENPQAWLYSVAKNKAINYINRNKIFKQKVVTLKKDTAEKSENIEIDLSEENIKDSQLKMLFAICHPSISKEAQIGLSLRILCGFGIEEIANAFLSNKETINKRLQRAKEKLRSEKISIEFPPMAEIEDRLDSVLLTLYLLFNEGYYSESKDNVIQITLCEEAMRLIQQLLDHEPTNKPQVNALFALMCFHSSRFNARQNERGEIILYNQQDETLWDKDMIAKGAYYLHQSSQGSAVSKYHIEATIAYWHTVKSDTKEKWENILQLFNQLLQIEYSPIAALNRTYALSKVKGNKTAIIEAESLKLTSNHYYFTLLGELYKGTDNNKAKNNFLHALSLAKSPADKQTIQEKLDQLQ